MKASKNSTFETFPEKHWGIFRENKLNNGNNFRKPVKLQEFSLKNTSGIFQKQNNGPGNGLIPKIFKSNDKIEI